MEKPTRGRGPILVEAGAHFTVADMPNLLKLAG
jgi:hypothetical protein